MKQLSAVHILALYSADGILVGSSSKLRLLVINLASVPDSWSIPQLHKGLERLPPFYRDFMLKENFILVENVNETEISSILSNLANLYADTSFTDGIELFSHTTPTRKFLITFQHNPDFERFAYFVNFIHYPIDMQVSGIVVKGFYQIKEQNSTIDFKPGEWLQLYISKNDTEHDNVSITNAINEGFLFDFGGKTKKLGFTEEKYHLPSIDKTEYSLLTVISPSSNNSQKSAKPWWKFW